MNQVLVDADLLVYRCGFAAEKSFRILTWDDPSYGPERREFRYVKELKAYLEEHHIAEYEVEQEVRVDPLGYCLSTVKSMLQSIALACDTSPDNLTLILTGSSNFRDVCATIKPYKGNRENAPKPVYREQIWAYMEKHYNVEWSVDEEADDVCAYKQMAAWKEDPNSSVIVTVDKDLMMIPGWHYDFVKETMVYIDEDVAEYNFWKQMLSGDNTDNIQGIKGVGDKTAIAMLAGNEAFAEEVVIAAYEKAYGDDWESAINENCILLNMRRFPGEMRRIVE